LGHHIYVVFFMAHPVYNNWNKRFKKN